MNAHVYEQITERIITLLTQGTVPWQKPWKARTGLPRNLVSQKPYHGINVFLLLAMSYESSFWLTFRQALQLGGNVRKGEKSCPVVFWKQTTIDDKESGESQKIPLLRFYHVFNVAQYRVLGAHYVEGAASGHPDPVARLFRMAAVLPRFKTFRGRSFRHRPGWSFNQRSGFFAGQPANQDIMVEQSAINVRFTLVFRKRRHLRLGLAEEPPGRLRLVLPKQAHCPEKARGSQQFGCFADCLLCGDQISFSICVLAIGIFSQTQTELVIWQK